MPCGNQIIFSYSSSILLVKPIHSENLVVNPQYTSVILTPSATNEIEQVRLTAEDPSILIDPPVARPSIASMGSSF
jgi:hypothetical protein